MATQKWKRRALVVVALIWLAECAVAQTLERYTFTEPHLGTIVDLTLYAAEEKVANEAARTAFARIKVLDQIFSDYKPDSEAMRLCEHAGSGLATKISPELYRVLKIGLDVSEQTDGAFDVTVGPMVRLWRRARKEKRLPENHEIIAAKELVDWKQVKLNDADQSAELTRAGMRLDFGGIAKGFIAQDVSRILRELGLDCTLVAVAGDIVAGTAPSASDGWKIGVAPLRGVDQAPSRLLRLENKAISTSGDAFQFVEIDGVRYSHIVDPKTGLGLTNRSAVTIVADEGTIADAWATAVCVLGPEKGLKFIEQANRIDALIVLATTNGVQLFESKDFKRQDVIPNAEVQKLRFPRE